MNKYTPTLIFLLLCFVFCLSNWNCAPISSYSFIETNGKIHSYTDDNLYNLDKKSVRYCQKHFEWETIKIRYTKNGKVYLVDKKKK